MGRIIWIGEVSGKRYEIYESASGEIRIRNVTDGTNPITATSTTIIDGSGVALNAHAARHEKGGEDVVDNLPSITLDDATFASLTADPPLAEGKVWYRADLDRLQYAISSTEKREIPYGTINVDAHAARHASGGADPIGSDALRIAQIGLVLGSGSSVNIDAGGTYTIPKGIHYVFLGANTRLELYDDVAASWKTAIAAGGNGIVISDGSNARLYNAGESAESSNIRSFQ